MKSSAVLCLLLRPIPCSPFVEAMVAVLNNAAPHHPGIRREYNVGWRAVLSSRYIGNTLQQEDTMAKGDQRSNKMAKKPKKDTSPPKEGSTSDRPVAPR